MYHMNDYLEQQWLTRIAERRIEELHKTTRHRFYRALRPLFDPGLTPYITSFSADGDVLSQWRAYSEDGTGFAIGFNTEYLKKALDITTLGLVPLAKTMLSQVIYEQKEQEGLLDRIIDLCFQKHLSQEKVRIDWRGLCLSMLWSASMICKNPKFSEEREWRIVLTPSELTPQRLPGLDESKPEFRSANGRITPYFKLSLAAVPDVMPITEVVFGPKNAIRENEKTVPLLLDKYQYGAKDIKPRVSAASYR